MGADYCPVTWNRPCARASTRSVGPHIITAPPLPDGIRRVPTPSTMPPDVRTHMKRPVKLSLLLCLACAVI